MIQFKIISFRRLHTLTSYYIFVTWYEQFSYIYFKRCILYITHSITVSNYL